MKVVFLLSVLYVSCLAVYPPWTPTWSMAKSTTVFHPMDYQHWPNNETTYADAKYGLVILDWGIDVLNKSTYQESKMEAYAQQLKSIGGPYTRVMEYRNTELGLSTFVTQHDVMYDSAYSYLWLKCGNQICNSPAIGIQDQYFWDYRDNRTQEYFLDVVVGYIKDKPSVDGIWFDDRGGLGDEHPEVLKYFTQQQIQDCRDATTVLFARTMPYLVSINKFNYFSFYVVTSPTGPSNCGSLVYGASVVASTEPVLMLTGDVATDLKQQIAAFLLIRQEYSYFGTTWLAGPYWYPEFDLDYGEPVGPMTQNPSGVFTRPWSKVTVTLDCNTWQSTFAWK